MLVVFIKSAVIFLVALIVIRIMGKRQLGEMQPYELVITLVLAEVACIPMNDPYIPIYYGIIPIITLGALHTILSLIARKSMRMRHLISGKSIIVIDKNGINFENIKKMNLNVNDLIESVRSAGYADFNDIQYAIFETNGKLCVIEKERDPIASVPALLPVTLFVDGVWNDESLKLCGVKKENIAGLFAKNGYKSVKEILYADIRQDGLVFVNPKYGKYFTERLELEGGKDW
jgi:uncharacterized membrane protein YcaP (DUF421 family)